MKNKKAERFGEVTLINAVSINDAKKLVADDFKNSGLKLEVFEEIQPNLFFCGTARRTRSESYYIYVFQITDKSFIEGESNA